MTAKRKKEVPAAPAVVAEVSGDDRVLLADAYKAGLILAWKLDAARGFCVSRVGRADEYVDVDQLTRYIAKLRSAA
jgi:hypothetical protein